MPLNNVNAARRAGTVPGSTAVMRVSGPAALLQAVPYLIGFRPSHSLVVVGLSDGVLVVTARLDLGSGGRSASGSGADLAHAVDVLFRSGVTEVVAIVYDAHPAESDVRTALTTLAGLVTAAGGRLLDTLAVSNGRWRSLDCNEITCCPVDGRALDEETSEFAAAATFAGVVVHPDRETLAAILRPDSAQSRDHVARLVDEARAEVEKRHAGHTEITRDVRATRALFAAARAADSSDPHNDVRPSDANTAQMGVWLADIPVRDSVWMAVDDGRLNGRPLWATLARRLPNPYDAAPAFLYGWAAWREGNGAMALIAAQRALDADPAYTAADLLLAAVSGGVDPRTVPKLRRARR